MARTVDLAGSVAVADCGVQSTMCYIEEVHNLSCASTECDIRIWEGLGSEMLLSKSMGCWCMTV